MLLETVHSVQEYIALRGIRFFKASEFVCRHCGSVKIESSLLDILEELRAQLNRPVIITSAYRCPVWNKKVGGVRNSAHVRGYAIDVKCTNSKDRFEIVSKLLKLGVQRIGIHRSFVHFDVDPSKPKPVIWLYGARRHVA